MKKSYLLGTFALAFVMVLPALAVADDNKPSAAPVPESIRQKLRDDYQSGIQNVRTNQGVRNNLLENRQNLASTSARGLRGGENENENDNRLSSTTLGRNGNDQGENEDKGYENNGKAMRENEFKIRKNNVSRQLQNAINNLKQIRTRVAARIDTAQATGRDMTNAKALLITADAKIVLAQNAVNAIINLAATSSVATSTSVGTTTIVDLNKPRQAAAGAIQAIKDAQRALNAVVVAIAHAMGWGVDRDGRVVSPTPTPTSTATTTPNVSTPTPTVTPTTTPSSTPTPTVTVSPTPTPTPTATASPSPTI